MSRWLAVVLGAAVLAASMLLTACESTQDKAKKVQAEAAHLAEVAAKPLTIPKPNKDVEVTGTTLLSDQNGDAIVVELKNNSKQPQFNLPIIVDLRDQKGKSIYKNNQGGIEPTLNHVPYIAPGEAFLWINDQLAPPTPAKSAKVTVGQSATVPPAKPPEIVLGKSKLENDPISGAVAKGTVTNKSQIDQTQLVIFGVARSGGKIVAAGRSVVKKLKADKPFHYQLFFIGDPKGAQLELEAPPTTLQ